MRKRVATAILAAAVAGAFGLTHPSNAQVSGRDNAAAAPAGEKVAPQPSVPVKQVVLYSSGVGYFEHFGTVKGNGSTELRFKTAQINDILKSLVLQDMDKGKIGVITYPSQDPVSKTLRSFQIDITANPSLAELLNQLRGARVTLAAGAENVSGTVLGVERKQRPMGTGEAAKIVEVAFINLINDAGNIRSVQLDDVRSFELADPKLREELTRALAALAAARDTDKKPVNISFTGDGERRVRIGYVVETPVWKTSYRLVLGAGADAAAPGGGEKPADAKAGDAKAADVKPADPKAAGGAAAKPAQTKGGLQGWAIVENQTDNDWADVQLSLVSGRPISFIQDLYQPLYVPRPVVQAELYASLRPQTYDAGMEAAKQVESFARRAPAAPPAPTAAPMAAGAAAPRQRESLARGLAADRLNAATEEKSAMLSDMDAMASVSSVASAAKLGELFQYTVGNVTLPRQTSAMIPVVTDPVEVEKVSIYNLAVLPKNPLLGARVKNTTGKHLLQGPVTVLDGGKYAGDARIDDVPPGQERLISYGVDQQVIVQAQNNRTDSAVQTGKIVKGVLHLTRKLVTNQEYTADNKGDTDKTLVIEQPKRGGNWKLVEPAKADETTDTLYRFKGSVGAGKATKLTVREELVQVERFAILNIDDVTLLAYASTGEIPKEVRDALTQAAKLRGAVAETQRQLNDRQQKVNVITQEQNRLRDNMKTVAQNTDYYQRLLKKLNDQESQIEGLQKEITDLQKTLDGQRKEMQAFVNGLNVG